MDILNIDEEMIEERLKFEEWLLITWMLFYFVQNYLKSTIVILILRFVHLFVLSSISTNIFIRAMNALQCNLKTSKTRSNNIWIQDILALRRLFRDYLACGSMKKYQMLFIWPFIYDEYIKWYMIQMTRQLQF